MRRIFSPGTNVKMVVFDMAGTIVNENGIIYNAIGSTLNKMGYSPSKEDKIYWYGKDKKEVLFNHIKHEEKSNYVNNIVDKAENILVGELEKEYFSNNNIKLMKDVNNVFHELRFNNIKVALNTGYPKGLQEKIIEHLCLYNIIDAYVSSDQVKYGRPYPYMIYNLMEQCDIQNVKDVVKVGDTKNDILEGINAGCGTNIGVLSGAGTRSELNKKSNFVINDISMLIDYI